MWSKVMSIRVLVVLAVSMAMLGVMACGGADEAAPAAPVALDAAAIESAVSKAVAASAPKTASSEEIQKIVEAAVAAQAQPGVTKADIESAVAASAGKQLTSADVKKIVDASLVATEKAVAAAAMDASKAAKAAEAAAARVSEALPILDPARTDPKILAKRTKSGLFSFVWDGPMPTKFNESPMLAELVKAGKLPPVEERLPDEPYVVAPTEAIGVFGGTWRMAFTWNGDHAMPFDTERLVRWDGDGSSIGPQMAKRYDVSNGGRVLTVVLRKGTKWSDGAPFTSADFKWLWDALANNEEYAPVFPSVMRSVVTKNKPKLEFLDELTVRYTWDDPNYPLMEDKLWGRSWQGWPINATNMFAPAHYLSQFHPDYADKAKLDKMITDAKLENWVQLIKLKMHSYRNPEHPELTAWHTVDSSEGPEWITERNPYYWAVDPAGNQLPYIDRVHFTLTEDLEALALKAISGEIDHQIRHFGMNKVPLYKKNEKRGNYYTYVGQSQNPTDARVNINWSYDKDPVIGKLLRTRDFRRALSLGMDREEIREIWFVGEGEARAYSPDPKTFYWPGEEYHTKYAVRDVKRANELLDGIGLTERDVDGFRLRPDGEKPLSLHFVVAESYFWDFAPIAEMIIKSWGDLGIKGTFKQIKGSAAFASYRANEEYFMIWAYPGWDLWDFQQAANPSLNSCACAVEVARGTEAADDPKYVNPEGEYPLKRLIDLHEKGALHPMGSPERIEIGKEIFRTLIDEVVFFSTVAGTGSNQMVGIVKNNFRNFPGSNIMGYTPFSFGGAHPELYFFDGGRNDAGF